jgi:Aldehyde dehydrogenase family
MGRCLERIAQIKQGDPLDRETMIGAQVSTAQLEKIESYVAIGINEGAEVLIGGHRPSLESRLSGGYYFEPTVLKGHEQGHLVGGPQLAPVPWLAPRARSGPLVSARVSWSAPPGLAQAPRQPLGWRIASSSATCRRTPPQTWSQSSKTLGSLIA